MAKRKLTMERYAEIKRLLDLKVSVRDIARTVRCTRRTIRQIRDGLIEGPGSRPRLSVPLWAEQMDWPEILREVLAGHPLKFIWEERAQEKITYINFWKQFHKQFPQYKQSTVVHRI